MKSRFLLWVAVLFLLSVARGATLQSNAPAEYKVKAIFLFNFAQFVEWPPAAFPDPQTPVIIGVLGEDPFGRDLDEVVEGEEIDGRKLMVRRYQRVEEVGECHILFISRSEQARLDRILSTLEQRSILTVSDADDFNRRGGMIRFVTEANRVRMRITPEAATRAGITLSSKLLRPAEIVPGRN